jgi:hypothetical protein
MYEDNHDIGMCTWQQTVQQRFSSRLCACMHKYYKVMYLCAPVHACHCHVHYVRRVFLYFVSQHVPTLEVRAAGMPVYMDYPPYARDMNSVDAPAPAPACFHTSHSPHTAASAHTACARLGLCIMHTTCLCVPVKESISTCTCTYSRKLPCDQPWHQRALLP